jgi:hypothetical protein
MSALSYISCLLTIASTVLVGRRLWQGWVVAGVNSVVIGAIGLHTAQWGFVPANLFCLALYAYNLRSWRQPTMDQARTVTGNGQSPIEPLSARLNQAEEVAIFHQPRAHGAFAGDERLTSDRVQPRPLSDQR